jgi:O-antigen/teichoic acid export membrane protein
MRLGRASAGVFASNLLNLVLSFGNSIFLTRTLGVVGKGEFAVFSASFGIFTLLLGMGLDTSLRFHVAKGRVPRERLLTSLLLFVLFVSGFVFATVRINDALFTNELFLPLSKQNLTFELVLAAMVGTTLIYSNISSVFAGNRSFTVLNWASIGFAALSLAVYGGLFWAKNTGALQIGSDEVFLTYLALSVFNAAVLGALAMWKLGVRPTRGLLDQALIVDMLRYAAFGYAANLAQFMNYRVDIWIVQYFEGSAALGIYSLAANLAMMLWILPRSISTVLLPALAADDSNASVQMAARFGRLVLVGTAVLAVPVAIFSGSWISLLYGSDFGGAAGPFALLLLGCVPFTLCVVQAGALGGLNRLDVNLTASTVGLAVTVALDFVLIPRYGIRGAAVASAASYLVTTAIVAVAFARIGSLTLRASILPTRDDVAYAIDGLRSLLR